MHTYMPFVKNKQLLCNRRMPWLDLEMSKPIGDFLKNIGCSKNRTLRLTFLLLKPPLSSFRRRYGQFCPVLPRAHPDRDCCFVDIPRKTIPGIFFCNPTFSILFHRTHSRYPFSEKRYAVSCSKGGDVYVGPSNTIDNAGKLEHYPLLSIIVDYSLILYS